MVTLFFNHFQYFIRSPGVHQSVTDSTSNCSCNNLFTNSGPLFIPSTQQTNITGTNTTSVQREIAPTERTCIDNAVYMYMYVAYQCGAPLTAYSCYTVTTVNITGTVLTIYCIRKIEKVEGRER